MKHSLMAICLLMIFLLQGCSVIGGIFKAGIWVGVLAVILLVIIVFAIANKVKK